MEPYDLRKFLTGAPKKPREPDGTPILGIGKKVESTVSLPAEPKTADIIREAVQPEQPAAEAATPETIVQVQPKIETAKVEVGEKDDYIAQIIHDMIISSGWIATRTTPEQNYYFYTYLPPADKRNFQQARVYISRLNLGRIITIEGLTIPSGIKDRLNIIIRMQKTGGIDRLRNSKTITQMLDVNNYFNQNSELVNPEGLRSVLSSYLREAEIL